MFCCSSSQKNFCLARLRWLYEEAPIINVLQIQKNCCLLLCQKKPLKAKTPDMFGLVLYVAGTMTCLLKKLCNDVNSQNEICCPWHPSDDTSDTPRTQVSMGMKSPAGKDAWPHSDSVVLLL